jgi:hypothetical protein
MLSHIMPITDYLASGIVQVMEDCKLGILAPTDIIKVSAAGRMLNFCAQLTFLGLTRSVRLAKFLIPSVWRSLRAPSKR